MRKHWEQHGAVRTETVMQQDGVKKDGRDQEASASQQEARGILKKESMLNKGKE
jgi:hypothetical protein